MGREEGVHRGQRDCHGHRQPHNRDLVGPAHGEDDGDDDDEGGLVEENDADEEGHDHNRELGVLDPELVNHGGGEAVRRAHIRHENAEHGAEAEEQHEFTGLPAHTRLDDVKESLDFLTLVVNGGQERHTLRHAHHDRDDDEGNKAIHLQHDHEEQEQRNAKCEDY